LKGFTREAMGPGQEPSACTWTRAICNPVGQKGIERRIRTARPLGSLGPWLDLLSFLFEAFLPG